MYTFCLPGNYYYCLEIVRNYFSTGNSFEIVRNYLSGGNYHHETNNSSRPDNYGIISFFQDQRTVYT